MTKPEKEHKIAKAWPFSFVNIDAKIPNSSRTKLQCLIFSKKTRKHPCITPGIQEEFNIRKCINITHHINRLKYRNCMILIDPRKRFHRINASTILKRKGLRKLGRELPQRMYEKPAAHTVNVKGQKLPRTKTLTHCAAGVEVLTDTRKQDTGKDTAGPRLTAPPGKQCFSESEAASGRWPWSQGTWGRGRGRLAKCREEVHRAALTFH